MPKIRNESRATSISPQRENKFIVFTDGKRRVLLTRTLLSGSYDDALNVLSEHFISIPRDRMTLQTDKLEACEGEFVDIPRESWSEVLPHLYSVMLVEGEARPTRTVAPITPASSLSSIKMSVTIQDPTGKRVELELKSPSSLVSTLLATYCSHLQLDIASTELYNGATRLNKAETLASQSVFDGALLTASFRTLSTTPSKQKLTVYVTDGSDKYGFMVSNTTLISSIRTSYVNRFHKGGDAEEDCPYFMFGDTRLSDSGRVGEYGIKDGDVIDSFRTQYGGKPVIYLFSRRSICARVRLSLVKEWSFSAIYPVVPIRTYPSIGQTLEWHVETHADGTLTERSTGLQTSYLFWEAETHSSHRLLSPPPSPSAGAVFSPVHSTLTNDDSVVLPVTEITPYLDASLAALSLHVEARTSFITYWLPALLRHTHIALRFVPQAAYEKAAPMDVTPAPDLVTRVFMLWKGITETEFQTGVWWQAWARARENVEMWKGVVGIQESSGMHDESAFRVLEWGGMEVKV